MTIEKTTLSIPRQLYQRAARLASQRNQDIATLLDDLLSGLELEVEIDEDQMAQEERAYQQLLPLLRERYLQQFVAIYQGTIVDHDLDELALLLRVEQQLPNRVVLLKRVLPQPELDLVIRSPRSALEE